MSAPIVVVGALPALEREYLARAEAPTLVAQHPDASPLREVLRTQTSPVSLLVTADYAGIVGLLREERALFRATVARLFVSGGKAEPFLPIDPRLKERYPEAFALPTDPALTELLVSGEAVIWLPGDVCLWRHWDEAQQEASLLSTLPALCLAAHPEPLPWLRLFRTLPARLEANTSGELVAVTPNAAQPNAYVVVAVDGAGLSRFLQAKT